MSAEEIRPTPLPGAEEPGVKLTFREPVAILLAVVLADACFYHGNGYAGLAAVLLGWLLIFLFGVVKPKTNGLTTFLAVLGLVVSAKLLWGGHPGSAAIGFGTVLLFGAIQAGRTLRFPDLTHYVMQSPGTGFSRLFLYGKTAAMLGGVFKIRSLAMVLIPLVTVVIFAALFVLANPNLLQFVETQWTWILEQFGKFENWVPLPDQLAVWLAVAVLTAGFLVPYPLGYRNGIFGGFVENFDVSHKNSETDLSSGNAATDREIPQVDNVMFYACRNTLVSVILLFVVYLVFEFRMNWLRNFPADLDYSGYMHQGAMFLTIALAVSTLVLCSIFVGKMLDDPRIARLRRLAWVWSTLNFFLALSVYNRLWIYVELNGLSRLRIAGFLGSTAVLLGFIVVVRKIAASKDFRWLLSRYTWSVLFVIFIGFAVPFDSIIARHNVRRVMNGELLPSIFLFPTPNAPEVLLFSLPLLEHEDEAIREGSRAIVSQEWERLEHRRKARLPNKYRWTEFQYSEKLLRKQLEPKLSLIQPYNDDPGKREMMIKAFRVYTNRWIN